MNQQTRPRHRSASGPSPRPRAGACLGLAAVLLGSLLAVSGCGQTLDVGQDTQNRLIPVDERNPVIIDDDNWSDNWDGEYASLWANSGGPALKGIIVTTSAYWPDANANVAGWNRFVSAARASGLRNIPDVTPSVGNPLSVPADGQIDDTVPNGSAAAHFIVDGSRQWSLPWRPVAVLVGTQLTDVADAYLIDPTVVDRVVVVAALGSYAAPNGLMGAPNGEMDPWADWIVAQRFRYVQLSAFYDQTADVTSADLPNLPKNPFGTWMSSKLSKLYTVSTAADQVAVLGLAVPNFVAAVQRCSPDVSAGFNPSSGQGPRLVRNPAGNVWLVTGINAVLVRSWLWPVLLESSTFGP